MATFFSIINYPETTTNMKHEKFIEAQIGMIKSGFELSQIRQEVRNYVFRENAGVATIDAMIEMCMELYAEIVGRSHRVFPK